MRRTLTPRELNSAIRQSLIDAADAELALGAFELFGRGHEPRVTLDRRLAAVVRGTGLPCVEIEGFGANRYYPRRVFERAVATLRRKLGKSPIAVAINVAYRLQHDGQ